MQILQPAGWRKPKGYSNGIAATGRQVFVAGQIGWDSNEQFAGPDFVSQTRQALLNTVAVLAEAGAAPPHIVRMNWYVIDKQEYLAAGREIGKIYRQIIGDHYPAMTLVQVVALAEDAARVEIETTAVIGE